MTDIYGESPFIPEENVYGKSHFVEDSTKEVSKPQIVEYPKFSPVPDPMDFLNRAKEIVYTYVKVHLEKTDTHVEFDPDKVYIVWFCKTLGNWKALLSTTLPDGMYYEVTHDGDRAFDYLDAYKKFHNVEIPEACDPTDWVR